MNDMSQFASAMLVLVFAAVMLVVGQLYIESRSAKTPIIRAEIADYVAGVEQNSIRESSLAGLVVVP